MSRKSTISLLFAAVLLTAGGAYVILFPKTMGIHLAEASHGMAAAGRLLQEMDVADEGRLLANLGSLASRSSLRKLLGEKPSEAQAKDAWLVKLRGEVAGLTAGARGDGDVLAVKDFFILNRNGMGLVRNIDKHWSGKAPTGHQKVQEAIRKAAEGHREALIVQEGEELLRAVVVPVVAGENVIGILYATFPLDDTLAKFRRSTLEIDVIDVKHAYEVEFAYMTARGYAAGAMSDSVRKSVEGLLDTSGFSISKVVDGKRFGPQVVEGPEQRWLVAAYPVTAKGGKGLCAIMLVRSLRALNKPFDGLALFLVGMAGLWFILLLGVTIVFGGRLARGLRRLEEDALEMATGDQRRRFSIGGPTAIRSLADVLNQIKPEAGPMGDPGLPGKVSGGGATGAQAEVELEELADAPEPEEPELEALEEELASDTNGFAEEMPASLDESPLDDISDERTAEVGLREAQAMLEAEAQAAGAEEVTDEPAQLPAEPAPADADSAFSEKAPAMDDDWNHEITLKHPPPLPSAEEMAPAESPTDEPVDELQAEPPSAGVEPEDIPESDFPPLPSEPGDAPESQAPPQQPVDAPESQMEEEQQVDAPEKQEAEEQVAEPPGQVDAEQAGGQELAEPAAVEPQEPDTDSPADEEEQYYRGVYQEFIRAKENVGEKVEKLNYERFVRKLKKQEELLRAKHACRAVRFQVLVKNNQVSLRPRIIR